MAKYRETPCKYYISFGECEKNRSACHKNYCQHCDKYEPRTKVKYKNLKRDSILRSRKQTDISFV